MRLCQAADSTKRSQVGRHARATTATKPSLRRCSTRMPVFVPQLCAATGVALCGQPGVVSEPECVKGFPPAFNARIHRQKTTRTSKASNSWRCSATCIHQQLRPVVGFDVALGHPLHARVKTRPAVLPIRRRAPAPERRWRARAKPAAVDAERHERTARPVDICVAQVHAVARHHEPYIDQPVRCAPDGWPAEGR